MIPKSREQFKQYCLRKLGEPAIRVNVTPEQVDDRVSEALQLFYERHYDAVEEIFILQDITAPEKIKDSAGEYVLDSAGDYTYTTDTDTDKGYLTLSDDIVAVTDVFRPKNSMGISSVEYQYFINEVANMINPTQINNGLSYYYMFDSHMTMVNRYFNPNLSYNFNPLSKRLFIAGGLKNADNSYGGMVLRALRAITGSDTDIKNDLVADANLWSNRWLQNWCTALIKENWGNNLGKYQQVQLLGGVSMNGDQILSTAKEELRELREELQNSYESLPLPFWG